MSKTNTIARIRNDGKLVRRRPDGDEEVLAVPPVEPMSDADIEAAAVSDPDNPPLPPERLARLRRVSRVKTLRRALGLTQEEFAGRYKVPLGTLRDWEQGRSEPDQPAQAYLLVIARAPEKVAELLHE